MTDNWYSSARIYPIAAEHNNSIKGTHKIATITLMMDNLILVKVSFST
jgi:hypothetical protein